MSHLFYSFFSLEYFMVIACIGIGSGLALLGERIILGNTYAAFQQERTAEDIKFGVKVKVVCLVLTLLPGAQFIALAVVGFWLAITLAWAPFTRDRLVAEALAAQKRNKAIALVGIAS